MSDTKKLLPGQYQLGDNLIFGRNTVYPVQSVEIQSYNIQAQDSQLIRSDEMQFGFDSLVPAPIVFELGILDFRELPGGDGSFDDSMYRKAIGRISHAWRADEYRNSWGSMVPLRYCDRDGNVRVWFGRPRRFQASRSSHRSSFFTVNAEFQRADTLHYSDSESRVEILKGKEPTFVVRGEDDGYAPSWLRIVGYGPITRPVITVGTQQIELDISVLEGEAFEINSYPWSRRAIRSNGQNVAAKLVGETQYLDRLCIPAMASTPIRWTSREFNTWVPSLENRSWSESIQDMNTQEIPKSFTTIAGKAVIRVDFWNFGGDNPWAMQTPSRYISSGMFGKTAAVIYNKNTYNTADQYCEAKIVEPFDGRSAITIMSNPTMTNFAMLEIASGAFNCKMRIRSGSAYNKYSEVKAEWNNPSVVGWRETDRVGIGYESATKTFHAYFNGQIKCSWPDKGGIVNTSNRHQGLIFDLDGSLFTQGTGFRDIVAYDDAKVPADTGRILVLWRNAYSEAAR